jgi:predicted lipoprotein with Yx(FWY)xxD motif
LVAKPETVVSRTLDALGDSLVAANGLTLYTFKKDEAGKSNCYDKCAEAWPPLLVVEGEKPIAGKNVSGKLGTTQRTDGKIQVTYNDQPLYFFAKDKHAGDATGQNVGEVWFVVKP